MCDGGSGSVDSGVKLPAYVEQGGEQLFDIAKQLGSQEYPTYPGQRIAQQTPDQLGAFDITRANVGAWQPQMEQAIGQTGAAAAPVGQADISQYMNPYTQSVIDPTVRELNRQNERDINQIHAGMASRGSYLNEDRREVIDQMSREGRDRNIADIVGRLNLQGFEGALGQANVQRNRNLAAGQQYAGEAAQVAQSGYGDAAALRDIGGQQQGQTQQNLSLAYDDFLRQFYYPQEQLNYITSVLRGTPYSTTQQTPVGQDNTFAQMAGLGIAGAGVYAMSDRRLKKNIKKVGKTPGGHNLYSFEFNDTGPVKGVQGVHVGVMADEVKKTQPEVVSEIDGYSYVDYAKVK